MQKNFADFTTIIICFQSYERLPWMCLELSHHSQFRNALNVYRFILPKFVEKINKRWKFICYLSTLFFVVISETDMLIEIVLNFRSIVWSISTCTSLVRWNWTWPIYMKIIYYLTWCPLSWLTSWIRYTQAWNTPVNSSWSIYLKISYRESKTDHRQPSESVRVFFHCRKQVQVIEGQIKWIWLVWHAAHAMFFEPICWNPTCMNWAIVKMNHKSFLMRRPLSRKDYLFN
jgi:hypothetical protein